MVSGDIFILLFFSVQGFPSFLAQALSGFGTPLDATGSLFLVDICSALPAFDPCLIGKNLHLIAAFRAFV
jgi:hypothetical protein